MNKKTEILSTQFVNDVTVQVSVLRGNSTKLGLEVPLAEAGALKGICRGMGIDQTDFLRRAVNHYLKALGQPMRLSTPIPRGRPSRS